MAHSPGRMLGVSPWPWKAPESSTGSESLLESSMSALALSTLDPGSSPQDMGMDKG